MNRQTPLHTSGKQTYWYLASPYSKYPLGLEAAYRDSCKAAGWLLKRSLNVFCPIAHSHPIAQFGDCAHRDHDFWMRVDKPLVDHACGMIIVEMPGWQDSTGVKMEIDWFTAAGKPIYYLRWPLRGTQFEWHKAPEQVAA